MSFTDDDLSHFAADGAPALPADGVTDTLSHDGARIWHASFGSGTPDRVPVILLHGGLGHSGNFGHQVPALVGAGHRVVVIDSRGHGRSTRDSRPYTYERMAGDLRAVMDALGIARAALVGWSDGACIALTLARDSPERVAGVFFFACNMDPGGVREIEESNPLLGRCFGRHARDYAALSATPDGFQDFVAAVTAMQRTQPDWTAADLAALRLPVTVALGEHDEFIKRDHAEYLARNIASAAFRLLPGVSHFAPLQQPDRFNDVLRDFLAGLD